MDMSKTALERDFKAVDKRDSGISPSQKHLERRRSFKDIQNAISRIDPKLLKSVITSRAANGGGLDGSSGSGTVPAQKRPLLSPPSKNGILPVRSPLPVFAPGSTPRRKDALEIAPLTIFYKGVVSVYNVPQDMAERIIHHAEKVRMETVEWAVDTNFTSSSSSGQMAEKLKGGAFENLK